MNNKLLFHFLLIYPDKQKISKCLLLVKESLFFLILCFGILTSISNNIYAEKSIFEFQVSPNDAWTSATTLVIQGNLVTMDTPEFIADGRIIIQDGKIKAILNSGDPFPSYIQSQKMQVIKTNGYIFPGFIDLHTHMSYDFQPLWVTGSRYENRYEWQKFQPHIQAVMMPKWIIHGKWEYNLLNEETLFSEVRALVGGTTSIMQTNPGLYTKDRIIRNIEYEVNNSGSISPTAIEISEDFLKTNSESIIEQLRSNKLKAWVIHLAEGKDKRSQNEFENLKLYGLLLPEVIIIHGTALTEAQLGDLGKIGGHLVWAPMSNLLLYGKTADIKTAMQMGVTISLSNDWAPSGSHNLLAELKIAAATYQIMYGEQLSPKSLVEMITVNPAKAIGWENYAGKLKEGLNADIIVVENLDTDPYETILKATEQHIQMVLIGGEPIYGNPELMEILKPEDTEVLIGTKSNAKPFKKRIDVTKEPGDMTFAVAQYRLAEALKFEFTDMLNSFLTSSGEPFNELQLKQYMTDKYSELQLMQLPQVFTTDDIRFFGDLKKMDFPLTNYLHSIYRPFDCKLENQ